jgi:Ser/Thr protein kinase RdoA (MazF antagonist)
MEDFYNLSPDDQALRMHQFALAALGHWEGSFSDVKLVKFRENAVFSARRSDGVRVALRVHRHGYHTDAELRSELYWMKSLADAGIGAPPIIPAANGEIFMTVKAPGVPEPRQVDMLAWVGGEPVGTSENGVSLPAQEAASLFFKAGALAARLHNHTNAMVLPDHFVRHAWDAEGLIGAQPFWGPFLKLDLLAPLERALLQKASSKAAADLVAFGMGNHNYGLIHADFVPENLLNDGDQLNLIDFDDSGFGWHMFELATALYFNTDNPCYPDLVAALIAGYRSARPLPDAQVSLLPLFMFLRGTTYLGWVQTRAETETAKELGPFLIERTCQMAREYLQS